MVLDTVRRLFPSRSTETPDQLRADVDVDELFEMLSNDRRRRVLRYITSPGTSEAVTLRSLAGHIAALENEIPEHQLGSQQRKRVYIALYQCHLPRMDDAGILEFEKTPGIARQTPGTTVASNVLETVDGQLNGGDA